MRRVAIARFQGNLDASTTNALHLVPLLHGVTTVVWSTVADFMAEVVPVAAIDRGEYVIRSAHVLFSKALAEDTYLALMNYDPELAGQAAVNAFGALWETFAETAIFDPIEENEIFPWVRPLSQDADHDGFENLDDRVSLTEGGMFVLLRKPWSASPTTGAQCTAVVEYEVDQYA